MYSNFDRLRADNSIIMRTSKYIAAKAAKDFTLLYPVASML